MVDHGTDQKRVACSDQAEAALLAGGSAAHGERSDATEADGRLEASGTRLGSIEIKHGERGTRIVDP